MVVDVLEAVGSYLGRDGDELLHLGQDDEGMVSWRWVGDGGDVETGEMGMPDSGEDFAEDSGYAALHAREVPLSFAFRTLKFFLVAVHITVGEGFGDCS